MIGRMEDSSPARWRSSRPATPSERCASSAANSSTGSLAGLGPIGLPVVVLDPRRGDTLPPPAQISGAVVTGSHAMVSHREPWSEATGAWLAQLVAHGTPLLGICFGHQLLAHALGGEAGNHPGGPEIGTVPHRAGAPKPRDDALLR